MAEKPTMEIKARLKEGVVVLDICGKIDVDSALFVETVGQCLRDGYYDILCNFEEVNSIDYMGMSVIVIAYKEIMNNKGRMKFLNIPAHLKHLFSVSGLDRVVEIFNSEDAAVNSFKEDKIIEDIKKLQLRRRFRRLPLDLKAELQAKYDSAKAVCKVDIINLSGVGAYVFGCDNFKLQDKVVIRVKLAPNNEQLELDAKVVWLPDKQIQNYLYPGMGVEFYNIENTAQEKLIEFVQRNSTLTPTDD
jgi:anti-anti-sigma factor